MNDIDLKNGYTRIANEILEVLATTDLNGTQRRIIDVVLRQTYGYQRKSHEMSLSFISKATNIHKMQIQRELASLIYRNILVVVEEATFNKSRLLAFNKNCKEWLENEQLTNKLTGNKSDNHTVSEFANTTVSEFANQIKKKENNKEIYISIVDYLNIKANKNYKATTKKTQSLIDARLKEGFTLDEFKKVINIKTNQWLNDPEMNKYLRPETIFGTKFESYLNESESIDNITNLSYKDCGRGSSRRL